ncbi:MAG: DUF434 domain-containing protein [Deltaproteobacteria bacterium]|nr:MAG: DUF434 domain-containing protein [Deltaproteobacteria bacterium]
MPRGAHPEDARLFAPERVPSLRAAVADLSWLLGRGYPERAARKLVGDRYGLRRRAREAVARCAASDEAVARRRRRRVEGPLSGRPLRIDGFNVLITVEVALSGGVLLSGRDGWLRDLASVHGTYRTAQVTAAAAAAVATAVTDLSPGPVEVLLDAPVSNSGRVAAIFRQAAARAGLAAEVRTVEDPDARLVASSRDAVVATADTRILDAPVAVLDLAGRTVRSLALRSGVPRPWILDLGSDA